MFHQTNMSSYSTNELGPKYVDLLQKSFIRDMANIVPVDFQNENIEATETINNWIAEQTKNKIPQLFKEPLGSDTLVVLASSLYFKVNFRLEIFDQSKCILGQLEWKISTDQKGLGRGWNTLLGK